MAAGDPTPMVSVHLACCNEPAPMVLAAIRSLQSLDWPYLEILIIDNNSDNPGCWMPVQAYVEQQRALGDLRVRFIRLPRWPGYKAGDPEAFAELTPEDRAAWDEWVASPRTQQFLDTVIDKCRQQAEANRSNPGYMVFGSMPTVEPNEG